MSAGEKALSMVFRVFLSGGVQSRGVLAQDAIHQFRELRAQSVEYALEKRGLDVLGRLMQQRVGEFQGLGQDGCMHRLGVETQRGIGTLLYRLSEDGNVARITHLPTRPIDASPA